MSCMFARLAALCLLAGALLWALPARAHTEITLGDYTVEYGWVTEPPIAGQANAIVLHFSKAEHSHESGADEHAAVDVSTLTVEIVYGGEVTALTLQPVADTPNTFTAAFTPARPGKHTLRFSGTLDGVAVSAEVEPEEVEPAGETSASSFPWAAVIGVGVVIALGAAFVVLRRRA